MSTLHAVDDHSLADEDVDLFMLLRQGRGRSDHDVLLDPAERGDALHDSPSARKKISIAPDSDTDGTSSGVPGHAGLSELGFEVELHLPDHRCGCELAPEGVAEIHAEWPDARVLLTSDGGVNSRRGIAAVRALGWTALVTDHCEELAPGSTADISVDPCRIDQTYARAGIRGAQDLYRVIEAYICVHRPEWSGRSACRARGCASWTPPGTYGLPANWMRGKTAPAAFINRPAGPDDLVSGSGRAPRRFDIVTSLKQYERRSQRHRTPAGLRRSRREGRGAGRLRSSLPDLVGRARGVRCRTWQGGGGAVRTGRTGRTGRTRAP